MHNTLFRTIMVCSLVFLLSGFRLPGFMSSEPHKQAIPTHYDDSPKHIALLLPLSGKHAEAGQAVKEGFLASYYENSSNTANKPIIRLYDTTKAQDVQKVYQHAIQQGADFVVGPLTKEEVLRLSHLSTRQTDAPILALNYHPQAKNIQGKLTQFSLRPEIEAEQLADKAWQAGYRRVGILALHTPWGQRLHNTFSQRWQSLGGYVTQTAWVDPTSDQSVAVRQLLHISAQQTLKDLKEQPPVPHFEAIVMLAEPEQARQLKPLLNFYYAEKIPVYATSSVYSGEPDANLDHDLNGVIFCDMPWLIAPQRYPAFSFTAADRRLFALGADAYRLISQLSELQSGRTYRGMTGDLYMVNQQIRRHLSWAQIYQGIPKSL